MSQQLCSVARISTGFPMAQSKDAECPKKWKPMTDIVEEDDAAGKRLLVGQVCCIMTFTSFSYAVYCVWLTSGKGVQHPSDFPFDVLARSIIARAVLLDIAVLSVTLFFGLLVTLVQSWHSLARRHMTSDYLDVDQESGKVIRDLRHGQSHSLSSFTISYKLFEMIVSADITIRLLRFIHTRYLVAAPMNDAGTVLLLQLLPCVAAVIQVSAIVSWFLSYQHQPDTHHTTGHSESATVLNLSIPGPLRSETGSAILLPDALTLDMVKVPQTQNTNL